jgi:hypothetical protein
LVNSTKRYLSKPEYRIQLDELFAEETERLIEKLDSAALAAVGSWNQEEFRKRVVLYEAATEPLARVAGVLGRWGDDSELPLVLDVILAVRTYADKVGSGLTAWLHIRSFPGLLIFTAYGLGLLRSQRWKALHRLLSAEIVRPHSDPQRIVEEFFLGSWEGGENNLWRNLEGFDRRKTALSDHLLDVFLAWSKSFVGIPPSLELLFEQFEVLASIVYMERTQLSALEQVLADSSSPGFMWMPVGRSGWHSSTREQVLRSIQSVETRKALLDAGFAGGSEGLFDKSIANFLRIAGRMAWP